MRHIFLVVPREVVSPIIRAIRSLSWADIHRAEARRVDAMPRHQTGATWSVPAKELLRPEPFFTAADERYPGLERCVRCDFTLQDWWPIGLCQTCRLSDQRLRDRRYALPYGRRLRKMAAAFQNRPREPKAPRPLPADFQTVEW